MGDFLVSKSLSQEFDSARATSLTGRVADIVSGHQNIGIADTGHEYLEIHEAITSDAFMQGLAQGGVKHLCFEYMEPFTEMVFQAYRDGKISDDDLQVIGQQFFVLNREEEYGVDPVRSRQSMIDYMKQAKAYGMELHHVNNYEGLFSKEDFALLEKAGRTIGGVVLPIVESDPDYKNTPNEEKAKYLVEKIKEAVAADPALKETLRKGLDVEIQRLEQRERAIKVYEEEGFSREKALEKVDMEELDARLALDDEVAERIEDRFGDEKVAVIYGRHHFRSRFGDIDANMKDIPVIDIYADRAFQDSQPGRAPPSTSGFKWFENERAEYSFDAKTNTWQEGENPPVQLSGPEPVEDEIRGMPAGLVITADVAPGQ